MKLQNILMGAVLATVLGAGCVAPTYEPYESCVLGDLCTVGGFSCVDSTLPASSYTGSFCTSGCTTDSDCLQDVTNYDAVCVMYAEGEGQCYLTCPNGSSSCPYGQSCFAYQDPYTDDSMNLCTP